MSRELGADDIWTAFEGHYLASEGKRFQLVDWAETHARGTGGGTDRIFAGKLTIDGAERSVSGRGNGLMSSVIAALAESGGRSEEHTSELQSLMRISYAVFCLKKKKNKNKRTRSDTQEKTQKCKTTILKIVTE